MRRWVVGIAVGTSLACASGTVEETPPAPTPGPIDAPPSAVPPAVADPEPDRDGRAGKRKHAPGKGRGAPGRGGKARPAGDAPPDPYVAEGVCPGECCTYREVSAREAAPVLQAPGGKEIARLAKGDRVEAETGEVHLHPTKAVVKHPHTLESDEGPVEVKPGDTVWVLDVGGEGWGHVWYDGGVWDSEILFAFSVAQCADGEPAEMCWATVDEEPGEQTWWVQVERADGTDGWVDNTKDVLTGFDACG